MSHWMLGHFQMKSQHFCTLNGLNVSLGKASAHVYCGSILWPLTSSWSWFVVIRATRDSAAFVVARETAEQTGGPWTRSLWSRSKREGPAHSAGLCTGNYTIITNIQQILSFCLSTSDNLNPDNETLWTGDRLVKVNAESIIGKTYSQVIGLIQNRWVCVCYSSFRCVLIKVWFWP